jgi:penicillin-binding protein 1C
VLKHFNKWQKIGLKLLLTATVFVITFVVLNIAFPLRDTITYSPAVYGEKGELLHAWLTPDQKWRMKTNLDEISPLLKKTIVFKEDKYFYRHPGINPVAVTRALLNNLFTGRRTSGASTITMQVARALEPRKRNYTSKMVEVFRAFQLELKYTKPEILRLYLNLVPYGGNIEGVKSAAFLYFGKNPDHLSLAEITALSIIPNRPSSLVIGKNNDRIVEQRNKWLKKFKSQGLYTEKEIADALNEPLTVTRGTVPRLIPHLAWKLKNTGNPDVHVTISMNQQSALEKIVADYSRMYRLNLVKNAAVVVIDNRTHKIVSYIGSASFKDTTDGGQVNGAAAVRQPGSTLKPLVYAMAIDQGLVTPATMLEDVAISYSGYAPENYDKQFNGAVTMAYALEHSLNVPAVKTMEKIGTENLISKLSISGFRQIEKDQRKLGLSMILGGCGATLEELTGLYAAFANEGLYYPASALALGNKSKPVRLISAGAAFMITEILSKVNRPDFPLNWQSTEHMPKIAWKTGTSYGRRDAWSIGYNKNFTVGVWLGNFSGEGVPVLSGANSATPLLFKIFNTIDYDSDKEWYSQPRSVSNRLVCAESGLPPAAFCTNLAGDYFLPMISPARACSHMQEVYVSANEKIAYCRTCLPASGYKQKLYNNYAYTLLNYFDEKNIRYARIPAHNPLCEKVFQESGPAIISPRNGSEYLIARSEPEPIQLICKAGTDVSKVYWYINDKFYKSAAASDRQFFVPQEGPVKISCTDDKGRNRNIMIQVKFADL